MSLCHTTGRFPWKGFFWFLLSVAYGLAYANAKWQKRGDGFLRLIGFTQLVYIPQLFYMITDCVLTAITARAVDDVLFDGEDAEIANVIPVIKRQSSLGTIVYGPGGFLFYSLQFEQDRSMEVTIGAYQKLHTLVCDRLLVPDASAFTTDWILLSENHSTLFTVPSGALVYHHHSVPFSRDISSKVLRPQPWKF